MVLGYADELGRLEGGCVLDDLLEQSELVISQGRWGVEDWGVPPGIMRSAPPLSLGMTAAGVERKGRSVGCFHSVYTSFKFHEIQYIAWTTGKEETYRSVSAPPNPSRQ